LDCNQLQWDNATMLTQEQQYELNRLMAAYRDATADLADARLKAERAVDACDNVEDAIREFIAKVAGG
jgi:hypothetical protein